jgi:hypothetical protein
MPTYDPFPHVPRRSEDALTKAERMRRSLSPELQLELDMKRLDIASRRAPTEAERTAAAAELAVWQTFKERREKMARETTFEKAKDTFDAGPKQLGIALAQLEKDAADGLYPAQYVVNKRAELIRNARVTDGAASDALLAYIRDAHQEAFALRARAEATRDPARLMAEELEAQRLIAGPIDGSDFAAQAEAMLANGQPERASMLAEVAKAKGARVSVEFARALHVALDEAIPDRTAARDIEREVEANVAAYQTSRARALASSFGIDLDGNVGDASSNARTTANIEAAMAEHMLASGVPSPEGAP